MSEKLGNVGENLACRFLRKSGCDVLFRNYRKPWGEIDIVGRARNNTLVFFEVKTLREGGPEALVPEDNLSAAKLRKLRRICQSFVSKRPELVRENRGWRIDLVAVTIHNVVNPAAPGGHSINHYENV